MGEILDFPKHFFVPLSAMFAEVMKASQQAIERGVKDCLFVDYKRRSGHFDVTTVASIKEITEKVFHRCLIYAYRILYLTLHFKVRAWSLFCVLRPIAGLPLFARHCTARHRTAPQCSHLSNRCFCALQKRQADQVSRSRIPYNKWNTTEQFTAAAASLNYTLGSDRVV